MDKNFQEILVKERTESLGSSPLGWVKRNGFDLVLKYIIFLLNSIGKRDRLVHYLFIDEIKNNNMHNNLMNTKEVFEQQGECIKGISFFQLKVKDHYKIGFFKPIVEILLTGFLGSVLAFVSLFKKSVLNTVVNYLYARFCGIVANFPDINEIYLMTDHHFYSSIVATEISEKCSVLQHGLVLDPRFYYPVRSGKFYAWGEHSKELQHNDPKVIVSGTYKFRGMYRESSTSASEINRIMFCIGSTDNTKVKQKIDVLVKLKKLNGFQLLIKCHPGSLFDKGYWEKLYKDQGLLFYKEELIKDISFDLAVSENSTVIMDLIALNKPFILFDDIEGYYDVYSDLIPHGNTESEITRLINKIRTVDFNKIVSLLSERELNSGMCNIYEMRRK